jgi:putative ABC transport system permease protein
VAGADQVAIVNATTANRYFPSHDAIGKSLLLTRGNIKTTIVGVVGDVRSRGPNGPVLDELFLPQSQSPAAAMSLVVRSAGPVAPLVTAVRQTVASIDRDLALSNISPMSDLLSAAVAQPRLTAQLTSVFGLVALLLSTIGIYGVLAYTVSQRTHEIALRLALGAVRGDVLRLVLGQGLGLVAIGIVVGSALALGAARVMTTLLVGTSARDPYTFGGVAILLVVVALLASYLPARRASRVDPIVALRR